MQGKAILTTGVVIINDDQILLIRNTEDSGHLTGTLGIPAGRVEPNEDTMEAAIRETLEEVGLTIKKEDLQRLPEIYYAQIMRKDGPRMYAQVIYYTDKFQGEPIAGDKAEPLWVKISEIDKYELLGNLNDTLQDLFQRIRDH